MCAYLKQNILNPKTPIMQGKAQDKKTTIIQTNIEAKIKLVVMTNTKPKNSCGGFVGGKKAFRS
jgi:hypothetical protein